MPMIRNEYVHNQKFRDYVDKYARQHGITADEALEHELVRQVFRRDNSWKKIAAVVFAYSVEMMIALYQCVKAQW